MTSTTNHSRLYDVACKTEGDAYDTGLRLRGLEVWAVPPHHYRHYTTFRLFHPRTFDLDVLDGHRPGLFVVGFLRPDGRPKVYGSYESREKAEAAARQDGGKARLCCDFEVGRKEGRPWGTTWADPEHDWSGFRFDLTEDEAADVIAFREEIDGEWNRRAADWKKQEDQRTEFQARAAALDDLPASVLNWMSGPTECLECGAEFGEPGHVEAGGMGCDRCN